MSERLPEGWKNYSINNFLGATSLFCDGDWVESKDQDEEGINRLIQLGDIGDGIFLDKSKKYMNNFQFNKLRCTELKEGDILIARMPDPLGRACLFPKIDQRCATVVDIAILRSPEADSYWLMYMINSVHIRRQIESLSAGSTRTRISRSLLANIVFSAPNCSIQKHIAKILKTIDQTIEKTEALIEKYQHIKAGLMHDLFTRGLTADGKLRPPREQAPELYQQTSMGWIPREWGYAKCEDICERICVGIVIRPADYYVSDGVPTFRSANVRETGITESNLVYITAQSNQALHKSQVRKGDILTVRTGYPGTSAVVPIEFDGCNCVDILITTPSHNINSNFLRYWINSSFGKGQVLRKQGGLAQQHFNVGEMRALLTIMPNLDEQLRILGRLDTLASKISLEENVQYKLQKQKSGLMQDLLTGKVQVKIDEE